MAASKKGFIDGLLVAITVALLLVSGLLTFGSSITGRVIGAPASLDQPLLFFSSLSNATVGDPVVFTILPDGARASITITDMKGDIRIVNGNRVSFDVPGVYIINALVYLGGRRERFSEQIVVAAPHEGSADILGGTGNKSTGGSASFAADPVVDEPAPDADDGKDDSGDDIHEYVIPFESKDLETQASNASAAMTGSVDAQHTIFWPRDVQDIHGAQSLLAHDEQPIASEPSRSARETAGGRVFSFFADKARVDVGDTVTFYIAPTDAKASITLTDPSGNITTLDDLRAMLAMPGLYEAIALIYDGTATERIALQIVAGNLSVAEQPVLSTEEEIVSLPHVSLTNLSSQPPPRSLLLDTTLSDSIVSAMDILEQRQHASEEQAAADASNASSQEPSDATAIGLPEEPLTNASEQASNGTNQNDTPPPDTTPVSSSLPSSSSSSSFGQLPDVPITTSVFTQGECGGVLDYGNSVTLTQNIPSGGACNVTGITVSGRGIVLNCDGFNITGNSSIGIADGGVGIVVNSSGNVSIRNCNVYNFTIGIVMNATGNQLGNITFDNVNLSNNSIGIIATTQQGQAYGNISLSNMTIFGTAGTCINYNAGAGENTLSNFTNINCMGNFTVSSDNITIRNSTIQNSSLILSGASDSQFTAIHIIASGYENNGIVAGAGSGNRVGNITIRHMFDGISFGVPEFNNSFFSNITIYDTNRSGIILDSNTVRLANLTFTNITIINTSSPGAGGRGIWFNGGRANNTTWIDINVTLGNSLNDAILVGGNNHSFTNVYIYNASDLTLSSANYNQFRAIHINESGIILSGASNNRFMGMDIIASGYENNGIVAGAGSGNRFGNITIRHMFDGISFGVPEFNNSFFSNITIYDTNRSGITLDSNTVRLANLTFYNITIVNTSSPGASGRGIWFNGDRANNTTWVDINISFGNSLNDAILVGGRNHSFTNVYIYNASGSDAFDFGQVGNAQNITIQNVTISHVSRGFVIQAQNLTIDNVRIYNNSGEALHFTNGTGNVSFTNLTISGEGTGIVVQQSPGVVRFLLAVFNNTIADPTGAASRTLSDSNSGSTGPFYFENTTFLRDVILFWASSSPSIWTNTNFTSTNMSVFFPYVNVTGNTVYSIYTSFSTTSNLVVNQSLIALNASALVDWNVSANITRYDANCSNFIIFYEAAYQTVATNMENDPVVASFRTAAGSDCDSPSSCADVSCANNILTFNVTNWSSYRIHQQPVCGNAINSSDRLYTDVSLTTGNTCFTITNNATQLNCTGSAIRGNGSISNTIGVLSTGRDSVNLTRCIVTGFATDVNFTNMNNTRIFDVNISNATVGFNLSNISNLRMIEVHTRNISDYGIIATNISLSNFSNIHLTNTTLYDMFRLWRSRHVNIEFLNTTDTTAKPGIGNADYQYPIEISDATDVNITQGTHIGGSGMFRVANSSFIQLTNSSFKNGVLEGAVSIANVNTSSIRSINASNITSDNAFGLVLAGGNLTVADSFFESNAERGISISPSNNVTITNVSITNTKDGIRIGNSAQNITIRNITARGGETGISILDSANFTVQNDLFEHMSIAGLVLGSNGLARDSVFRDLTIRNATSAGVLIVNSARNLFQNLTVSSTNTGITFASTGNYSGGGDGNNTLLDSVFFDISVTAIYFGETGASVNNTISGINISNATTGIIVASQNNRIYRVNITNVTIGLNASSTSASGLIASNLTITSATRNGTLLYLSNASYINDTIIRDSLGDAITISNASNFTFININISNVSNGIVIQGANSHGSANNSFYRMYFKNISGDAIRLLNLTVETKIDDANFTDVGVAIKGVTGTFGAFNGTFETLNATHLHISNSSIGFNLSETLGNISFVTFENVTNQIIMRSNGSMNFSNLTIIGSAGIDVNQSSGNVVFYDVNFSNENASVIFSAFNFGGGTTNVVNDTTFRITGNATERVIAFNSSAAPGMNTTANVTTPFNCDSFAIFYNSSFDLSIDSLNRTTSVASKSATVQTGGCTGNAHCTGVFCDVRLLTFTMPSWSSLAIQREVTQPTPPLPSDGGGGSPSSPPGPPPSSAPVPSEAPAAEGEAPGEAEAPAAAEAAAEEVALAAEEALAEEVALSETIAALSEAAMASAAPSGKSAKPAPPAARMTILEIRKETITFFRNNKQISRISFPAGANVTFDALVRNSQKSALQEIYLGMRALEGIKLLSVSPESFDEIGSDEDALFHLTLYAAEEQPNASLLFILESNEGVQLFGFIADVMARPAVVSAAEKPLPPVAPFSVPVFVLSLPILLLLARLLGFNSRAKDVVRNILALFYKTTIADEEGLREVVVRNLQRRYWRIKVTPTVYKKYHKMLRSISPIFIYPTDRKKIQNLSHRYKVDLEHATLLLFASRVNNGRMFTMRSVSQAIKDDYKTISFENPLEKAAEIAKKQSMFKRLFMPPKPGTTAAEISVKKLPVQEAFQGEAAAPSRAQAMSPIPPKTPAMPPKEGVRVIPMIAPFSKHFIARIRSAYESGFAFVLTCALVLLDLLAGAAVFLRRPIIAFSSAIQKSIRILASSAPGIFIGKTMFRKRAQEKPAATQPQMLPMRSKQKGIPAVLPKSMPRRDIASRYAWFRQISRRQTPVTKRPALPRQPAISLQQIKDTLARRVLPAARTTQTTKRIVSRRLAKPCVFKSTLEKVRNDMQNVPLLPVRKHLISPRQSAKPRVFTSTLEKVRYDMQHALLPSKRKRWISPLQETKPRPSLSILEKVRHDLRHMPMSSYMRRKHMYQPTASHGERGGQQQLQPEQQPVQQQPKQWRQPEQQPAQQQQQPKQQQPQQEPATAESKKTMPSQKATQPQFTSVLEKIRNNLSRTAKPMTEPIQHTLAHEVLVRVKQRMDSSQIAVGLRKEGYDEDEINAAISKFNKDMKLIDTWVAQAVKLGRSGTQIHEELCAQGFSKELVVYHSVTHHWHRRAQLITYAT